MNIRCPGCGAVADGKREYEHVDGGDAKMEGFPKGLDSDKW